MKARPILFSAPMVRALLEGRKTQTRRIVKPAFGAKHPIVNLAEHGEGGRGYSGRFNDPASWGYPYAEDGADMALADWPELCPYGGKPGDLLWVRETFCDTCAEFTDGRPILAYEADFEGHNPLKRRWVGSHRVDGRKWKPSIHMPRWASRLTLEITDVRVQRLNKISDADCVAEGVGINDFKLPGDTALICYRRIWEEINGSFSWGDNPWVWALGFRVHKVNVDELLKQREAA